MPAARWRSKRSGVSSPADPVPQSNTSTSTSYRGKGTSSCPPTNSQKKARVITGPTSGIGYRTALALGDHWHGGPGRPETGGQAHRREEGNRSQGRQRPHGGGGHVRHRERPPRRRRDHRARPADRRRAEQRGHPPREAREEQAGVGSSDLVHQPPRPARAHRGTDPVACGRDEHRVHRLGRRRPGAEDRRAGRLPRQPLHLRRGRRSRRVPPRRVSPSGR